MTLQTDNLFSQCRFRYPLREYQARVLKEIPQHLDGDGKIHVVAAPGAGKTSLALQIVINIGKPTLVLTPTIVLREQWLDRFLTDFAGDGGREDAVSDKLEKPGLITAVTYQSLYAEYAGVSKGKRDSLAAEILKKANVKVIVLDEAHHLTSAWLDAANDLIERIGGAMTISLTATPPYDLKHAVWKKYISLCGDIDVEITVPELIKKQDLAPHQDYIYFNHPTKNQADDVESIHLAIDEFVKRTVYSEKLIAAISLHDGIVDLSTKTDYFIEHFDYYMAMLKFLNLHGIELPQNDMAIDMKDIGSFELPDLEKLLTYCLYQDARSYAYFKDYFREVRRELNAIGAISDRRVVLGNMERVKRRITQNIGKLNSIKTIVREEREVLGDRLKLVVISDNIYKQALDMWDEEEFKQLGVAPIFASLVRSGVENVMVLTGEIAIIPVVFRTRFAEIAHEFGVPDDKISIEELSFDFDYARVCFSGESAKEMVGVMTKMFETSDAHILVGSAALIGEGWDAPFVNSLIMATSIASYVTSNQVRGRAIRTCKNDPAKTANIWHLVCVEKLGQNQYVPGMDYAALKRRFETFEGVGAFDALIDHGIDRLNIEDKVYDDEEIAALNKRTLSIARDQAGMRANWERALVAYRPVRINKFRSAADGARDGLFSIIAVGPIWSWFGLTQLMFASLPVILKERSAFIFSLKNGVLYFIGTGILKTLIHMKMIRGSARLIFSNRYGETGFYLQNCTLKENQIFRGAFMEFVSKVDNPRHIIKRKSSFFAVPGVIGSKMENVRFLMKVLHLSGKSELIFTRSPAGRLALLQIKLKQSKASAVSLKKAARVKDVDSDEHVRTQDEASMAYTQTMVNVKVLHDDLKSKSLLGGSGE